MKFDIPSNLQSVLWSSDVRKLNLQTDKNYIIHQILSNGRLEDIKWLFGTYPKDLIAKTFISKPYKDYAPARFNFVKNFILGLNKTKIDERFYVENTTRNIR